MTSAVRVMTAISRVMAAIGISLVTIVMFRLAAMLHLNGFEPSFGDRSGRRCRRDRVSGGRGGNDDERGGDGWLQHADSLCC